MQPCADCINDASGVEPKAAPGGQDGRICGMSDGEIGAGEPGGGEPSRRLSGGRCGRSRRQSCAARCRRRGRWCSHWCGHYCTARCGAKYGRAPQERPYECSERCAAKPAPGGARGAPGRARRGLRRALCEAQARGERGGGPNEFVERCSGGGGPARGGERSEPPGKRSAQRPKGAEARGIPARRGETAQRARQGSPVAKRRAQPHRMAHRTGIRPRHRHQHHCLHRCQHRSHRDRHRQRHQHRHQHQRRHRRARDIVVERGETVKTLALSLVKRRVREVVRRKSGGAAAERGAAGDARSEGGPCGWRRRSGPTKEKGRAAEATRPVVAMRATRRPAGPGFRAGGLCRRGSR